MPCYVHLQDCIVELSNVIYVVHMYYYKLVLHPNLQSFPGFPMHLQVMVKRAACEKTQYSKIVSLGIIVVLMQFPVLDFGLVLSALRI